MPARPRTPTLSAHAIERWQERVDPSAPRRDAATDLLRFVLSGRRRPTPRHWTAVRPQPGVWFVYDAEQPGVCAVVVDRTVVTVLTRALCRATNRRRGGIPEARRRPVCLREPIDVEAFALDRWPEVA